MTRFFLIAMIGVLTAAACDVPSNPETDPPAHVDVAINEAALAVQAWFDAGASPTVTFELIWLEGDCIRGMLDVDETECVTGVTYDEGPIYVLARERVWQTMLTHELLHHFAEQITGDGDADHHTDIWTLEGDINARICQMTSPDVCP
jgi:hypothetical protein